MKQADIDEKYMRRCLQLAYNGMLKAKRAGLLVKATMCNVVRGMQK